MAGKRPNAAELKRLETLSINRRKLIGQAIIDGLLTPGDAALLPVASDPDYDQGQGDYNQRTGDHNQSGGGYTQGPREILSRDPVIDIIRPVVDMIRDVQNIRSKSK